MRRRVLLISANEHLRLQVRRALRADELRLIERSSMEPVAALVLEEPDLVLLDVGVSLPRALSALRLLRLAFAVPVLTLLQHGNDEAEVMCLNAGAVGALPQDAPAALLIARVHAALGSPGFARGSRDLCVGPLRLERDAHRLLVHDQPVALRRTEYVLVEALMAQPRHTIERASLKRIVWDGLGTDRALDSAVSRARRAVLAAGGPRVIVPMRGIGYRLGIS
jgi:DNA-binding response OmpR family regulator